MTTIACQKKQKQTRIINCSYYSERFQLELDTLKEHDEVDCEIAKLKSISSSKQSFIEIIKTYPMAGICHGILVRRN